MVTYEHSFSIPTSMFVDKYKSVEVYLINKSRQQQDEVYVWNVQRNNNMEGRLRRKYRLGY